MGENNFVNGVNKYEFFLLGRAVNENNYFIVKAKD